MREYFESTLRYTVYLLASIGIGVIVCPFGFIFLILPFIEGKIEAETLNDLINYLYNFLTMTAFPLAIIYIAMRMKARGINDGFDNNGNMRRAVIYSRAVYEAGKGTYASGGV